jgi:hypothetical protein
VGAERAGRRDRGERACMMGSICDRRLPASVAGEEVEALART